MDIFLKHSSDPKGDHDHLTIVADGSCMSVIVVSVPVYAHDRGAKAHPRSHVSQVAERFARKARTHAVIVPRYRLLISRARFHNILGDKTLRKKGHARTLMLGTYNIHMYARSKIKMKRWARRT